MQIDRFEDKWWAVLPLYCDDERRFDAPRELPPAGVSPGDVFELRLEHDRAETESLTGENRRLLGALLKREEG